MWEGEDWKPGVEERGDMTMPIVVQCGSCSKRFGVKEELAGRKFKCPVCGGILTIPGARPEPKTQPNPQPKVQPSPQASAPPKAQPKPQTKPARQITDLLDDYAVASPAGGENRSAVAVSDGSGESAADDAPKCPACGAKFTPGATLCFECGYDRRVGKKREVAGPKAGEGRRTRLLWVLAVGGVWVILLVIGFIGYLMFQPQGAVGVAASGITETPKEFVKVQFGEDSYECDCPKSWSASNGGGKGGVPPWTTLEKGGAAIEIRDSASGTPGGALQRQLHMGTDVERGELPIDKLHEIRKESTAKDMRNYEESAPKKLNHLLGDALIAEFTAKPMLSGPVHGYHATVFDGFHQFTILCRCTEPEWETLKPAFEHVISSLVPIEEERKKHLVRKVQ